MKIKNCTLCEGSCGPKLSMDKKVISRFSGNIHHTLFIIGEAPGYNEYLEGLPFVGASGRLLQEFLDEYLSSDDSMGYYITNTIKCRPEGNADPSPDQKDNCRPYLLKQLNFYQPKVVLTLGKHAAKSYSQLSDLSFDHVHINLYHPAYLLYNGKRKDLLDKYHQTFKVIRSHLDKE